MTKASDNIFPKVTFVEGSAPSSPSATDFHLYFDSSDHLLKWKNSAGTVTSIAANPMTTAGDTIYGGASGVPTRLAGGTSTYVLTSNGATSPPSWQAPAAGGGGALVFLEAHTASSSATLDFTTFISATYDYYLFEAIGIQAATNDVSFNANMGTGAGPTWDTTSGHYGWTAYGYTPAGAGATGSASTTAIQIRYHVPNSGNYRQSATFRLFLPASANPNLTGTSEGYDTANGAVSQNIFTGTYISTTAVTGVRFSMSSGNFDGTIRVYGITKS